MSAAPQLAEQTPTFPWSWRVGRLAGITVRVHATLLLLFGWILLEHLRAGDWVLAAEGVALTACTFAIIVLHELGHALVARRFGVRTRDITLLPLGGVATLDKLPEKPREELAVAIAGPAVNFALALLLFGVLAAAQGLFEVAQFRVVGGPFIAKLLMANLTMGVFNLLPAFPMDGGRVLRALLASRRGRVRATELASHVGMAFALLFAAVGLFFSPMLIFIALFVWMGAQQELAAVRLQATLAQLKAADAMITRFQSLDAQTPVSEAMHLSLRGFQHDFPVTSDSQLRGILTREELLDALETGGPNVPVGSVLHGALTCVEPATPLWESVELMRSHGASAAAVLDHGKLVGLLTGQNVAERLMASARAQAAASH